MAALDDGEGAAGDGCREEDGDADQEPAQAAVGAPDTFGFLLGGVAAFGDEGAFELVQLEFVLGGPVEGGGEAGTAVELAMVAAGRVPLAGGLGEVAAQAAALAVLLDPFAQAWPFAQQGFVGDFNRAFPTP